MTLRWRCDHCNRCFYNRAWAARFAVVDACPSCEEGHVHRWGRRRARRVRALAR